MGDSHFLVNVECASVAVSQEGRPHSPHASSKDLGVGDCQNKKCEKPKAEDSLDSIVCRPDQCFGDCVSVKNGPSACTEVTAISVCTVNECPTTRGKDAGERDYCATVSLKAGGQNVCSALRSDGGTCFSAVGSDGLTTCVMQGDDSSACPSKGGLSPCVKEGHYTCFGDVKMRYEASADITMGERITNTTVCKKVRRGSCIRKKASSSLVKTIRNKGDNYHSNRKLKAIAETLLKEQQICSTLIGEEVVSVSGLMEGANSETRQCMTQTCPSTRMANDPRPVNFIVEEIAQNRSSDTAGSMDQEVMERHDASAIGKAALLNAAEAMCELKTNHNIIKETSVTPGTGHEIDTSLSRGLVWQKHEIDDSSGRCCICSNDQSWPNNLLVYCDGESGCDVAVHQGCYGIVKVPEGPWLCRKCESQERAAKLKCDLCPGKFGAFKRTDNGGWAHVVCALYIPEVSFGCTMTMEPILLKAIPRERFTKVCYICHFKGRESKGACMTCNVPKCVKAFHATCAQSAGLLCAEKESGSVTLKYCGYCKEHFIHLTLFAKEGKKKASLRSKEEKQKFKISKSGDKKQSEVHSSLDTDVTHRKFKCGEDTAYLKSTVDPKEVFSRGMDESVKITASVSNRKRKSSDCASQQRNRETGEGTTIKGKKVKLAVSTTNEELVNKCNMPKKKSKQIRSPKERKCVPSQIPFSSTPSSTSCSKNASLQKMRCAITVNNDSQASLDVRDKNLTKATPKRWRQRNRSENASKVKLFRGKTNAELSKDSTVKSSSKLQCSKAICKAQRLPKTGVKDANLQKFHPEFPSNNGDSTFSCASSISQHDSVPVLVLNKGANKRTRILVSSEAKIPRKTLARNIHPHKPCVKGVSIQKVSHAVDVSVSPSLNLSMTNSNLQILPPLVSATVNSEKMTVEVPILQKLSPTNQKDVRLQKLRLHISSLKSHRALSQESALKPRNTGSPASTISQRSASGNDSGELSCKNGLFLSGLLLPEDSVSSTSPGDTAPNLIQDSLSIEQLLERQWSEGQEFLLEHGTFSELLGLLSSLSQLQMENDQLEQKIRLLTVEKERLQLMKCQLSFPLLVTTSNHASLHREIGLSVPRGCQKKKFADCTSW